MATSRSRAELDRFFDRLPAEIERKLLRGAGRAAAKVVAEEARDHAPIEATREAIAIRSKAEPGRIVVRIVVKPGWGRTVGKWAEYGTSPHFISVDESQRGGRTIGRINREANEPDSNHSLVINGQFVGDTVFHPGARQMPFMRPAFDLKRDQALVAAQSYINARVTPRGIVGGDDTEDEA